MTHHFLILFLRVFTQDAHEKILQARYQLFVFKTQFSLRYCRLTKTIVLGLVSLC